MNRAILALFSTVLPAAKALLIPFHSVVKGTLDAALAACYTHSRCSELAIRGVKDEYGANPGPRQDDGE